MKWLLWTENEGQAVNCLHCQHLADTQSKQGQKPWKGKAEKGSSESLSQQQVRTRLRAKVGQHKECEGWINKHKPHGYYGQKKVGK